jgi:3-deoxy-D-manno-octulosonic-acid transferase
MLGNRLFAARSCSSLGCSIAIITGPHTHNFASIIEQFEANAAIRVVADKDALAAHTMALLKDDAARETLAVNAQKTVEQFRGASTIILQHVGELIARGSA